ncbi:MAG: hypothetical protein A3G49_03665 [Candidatus Sungbacteria bacterium RIFCSPLOWO2_12_FULL_41_11]|uniref:Prepilin type IV endopeptidase peptidase domain-containing protein n=1 Tax=Candidatus Sungbacteria bacterium RIFCSPLOWO2_12_FULL_41_11 TaxID=1802286 RepID=A0A1G2LPZ6_9BACT|nr:MAG: hypothetical protein A3D41_01205 [Candidatus Sungbacteria bacterium RIFCSPHIGHO2_02_FULL_41_12b]OHA13677.1 MAG: hypothetical protein A3G49_03665 [Candidatus Sungbacteria bacterium RIFCSPLOWO2_12_FULL_41_11]
MDLFDIINLLYYFIFASLLIVAFVYDFKHKLIPDFTSYGIFTLAAIRIISLFIIHNSSFIILSYDFLAALAVLVLFGGIWYFFQGRAMGFGDVKLAPAITLFLGFSNGILAILLSFWLGSIIGLLLIGYSKFRSWHNKDRGLVGGFSLKSEIPFGPFLVLGALIALLWGEKIISLYFQFLLY